MEIRKNYRGERLRPSALAREEVDLDEATENLPTFTPSHSFEQSPDLDLRIVRVFGPFAL